MMAYLHPDMVLLLAAMFVLYIFIGLYRQIGQGNRGFTLSFLGISLFLVASFFNYFEETPYGYLMLAVTDEAGWDFVVPIFGYAPGGLLFCFGFIEWLKTAKRLQTEVEQRKNTEEELIIALEDARQANLSKNVFFSSISHELRTPLTAIIGFAEIMADKNLDRLSPEQRADYAQIIKKSGDHLLETIEQLLRLADSESQAHVLDEETFAMAEVARDCTYLMKARADKARLALSLTISDAFNLWADKRLVRHIVLNLLDVAISHTEAKQSLELQVMLAPDGHPILCLKGACRHMSMDAIQAALLPFDYDADVMTRPKPEKGVGLTLAQRYVGLHGGQLMIEPAVENGRHNGATIWISFPTSRLK